MSHREASLDSAVPLVSSEHFSVFQLICFGCTACNFTVFGSLSMLLSSASFQAEAGSWFQLKKALINQLYATWPADKVSTLLADNISVLFSQLAVL